MAERPSSQWRQFRQVTLFSLVAMYVPGLLLNLQYLSGIALLWTWTCAFMWGYLYRAHASQQDQESASPFERGGCETGSKDPLPTSGHRVGSQLWASWRTTMVNAVILGLVSAGGIVTGVEIVEGLAVPLAGWLALLAGFRYRETVDNETGCPRWRFLRVVGDCLDPAPPR